MKHLNRQINQLFDDQIVHHLALRIGRNEEILHEVYRGDHGSVDEHTRFDMASVSKILATTSIALIALATEKIHLEDRVTNFFPGPVDKQEMTIRHLLTHTMGVGHMPLNFPGNTYENIPAYILDLPSQEKIGTKVLYSCPGFILLGRILEKVYGKRIDILFQEMVARPLGMTETCFCPEHTENMVNSNRDADFLGVVNDYNCRFLGCVAGNAGVFSNIADMTRYIHMLQAGGVPLFSRETLALASQNYTASMGDGRGLGFLYVDEHYAQTGDLFPVGSIGHCGHTGQSFFLHREIGLYVILLTDATVSTVKKYGKENYEEVKRMRADLHHAIKLDLQEMGSI